MISARRRVNAAPPPRAMGVRAPTHIPFRWQGARGPQFAPVGGVQAFADEREKLSYLRDTMRQEVQLYKGSNADAFLQDKVADEMAKEVAQGVLEEHKSRPDRDYNACFQSWLLGKNDVLNNPLITQRGYTSYVQKFPRVVNWVDAQIQLASEIKVYLVRLYTEGPSTEEEVEHEFRYLVWPLNNALRILQQARNDTTLGPETLRGVKGGAWDPQHQTAGGLPWPAELTYMGRVPDASRKDIPPCLHPALNPYMRDQWVYSVSYKEWLAGDFSKLRGDSRELWEVVANRLYGRNDRMQKPAENTADPQQQGEWGGPARPEGAWGAAREEKPCGRTVMPATQRPLVPVGRPWLAANPVPSAPPEEEEEGSSAGSALIDGDDVAKAEREWTGEDAKPVNQSSQSHDRVFEQLSQNMEALRDMIRATRDMFEAQTRSLQQAPRDSVPGSFPETAEAEGTVGGGHPDLPVIDESGVSGAEAALAAAREALSAKAAHRASIIEAVLASMASAAASATATGVQAVGAGAASVVRSLLAADDDGGENIEQPPSIYMPVEEEPAPTSNRRTRRNADAETVREGAAWLARGTRTEKR